MATQDFAKKHRRSGGSSGRSRAKQRAGLPWGRLLLVVLLLGGFAFVLLQLTKVKTDPNLNQQVLSSGQAPAPAAKEAAKPATKVPPPPPKPQDAAAKSWDFYKLLPESEVPLPSGVEPLAPPPPPPPPTANAQAQPDAASNSTPAQVVELSQPAQQPVASTASARMLLQAGAFRTEKEAEALRVKLFLQGLQEVSVTPGPGSDGGTWWRVRVGPYSGDTLSRAEGKLSGIGIQAIRVPVK